MVEPFVNEFTLHERIDVQNLEGMDRYISRDVVLDVFYVRKTLLEDIIVLGSAGFVFQNVACSSRSMVDENL